MRLLQDISKSNGRSELGEDTTNGTLNHLNLPKHLGDAPDQASKALDGAEKTKSKLDDRAGNEQQKLEDELDLDNDDLEDIYQIPLASIPQKQQTEKLTSRDASNQLPEARLDEDKNELDLLEELQHGLDIDRGDTANLEHKPKELRHSQLKDHLQVELESLEGRKEMLPINLSGVRNSEDRLCCSSAFIFQSNSPGQGTH